MLGQAFISALTCWTLLGSRMKPGQIDLTPSQTAAARAHAHLLRSRPVAGQHIWPSWAQHGGAKSIPQRSGVGLQCRAI